MIPKDILKKIKQIEIHTKRLLSGSLVGDSRSALKGSGFEFDQIREYQLGDDVRFIDWNSSARMNALLVKQYIEERNRPIVLAVDVSSSSFFSSSNQLKFDVFAQIAGVLALVADYGKDCTALLLFSDTIECYIPLNKGRSHTRKILERLFSRLIQSFKGKKTDINVVFEQLAVLKQKNALIFLISDFINQHFEKNLRIVAKKHDLIAVRCLDAYESRIPNIGFIQIEDIETGKQHMLDARKHYASMINTFLMKRLSEQDTLFKKCGVDLLTIDPNKPFVGDIIRFFRRRMMY